MKDRMTEEMKEKEKVTALNSMEDIKKINQIQETVEETILQEIIFQPAAL